MIFKWLTARRRQQILSLPFQASWTEILERNIYHWQFLSSDERRRLQNDLRILVAEKNWEGCGGLELNDEIKVTVAAQASVLLLGLEHDYFANVQSILVYPRGYLVPRRNEFDVQTDEPHLGEAWYRGPVILSWSQIRRDSRRPGTGNNLVWHEFAHQLDMLDRETNGTPPLRNRAQQIEWRDVMTAEYASLIRSIKRQEETLLDPYGATNEAEFFAVATETFFDLPHELQAEHPDLYRVLQSYFGQDPASRLPRVELDEVSG